MPPASDGNGYIERHPFSIDHPIKAPRRSPQPRYIRKKSNDRVYDQWKPDQIGGEHIWRCFREGALVPFRNQLGFASYKKTGTPCGWTKETARIARERAKKLAKLFMKKHREQMITEDEKALGLIEIACEIAHDATANHDTRLRAINVVLPFLKPKPRVPQEVRIDTTAETWLAAIEAPASVALIEASEGQDGRFF